MNIETAKELLAEHAPDSIEPTIEDYTTTVQCKWISDDGLERVVHLDTYAVHRPDFITVAYSVWHDDYETLERKRYEEDIAVINPDYDDILTKALTTAFQRVQTIDAQELEPIDHLEPQQ